MDSVMRPSFSLVLPVYNVAPYLPACLSSLATLIPAPDEIIAVDDGSTDGCSLILADYARRMPNLRVIRQENGGLSAARNTGLDAASGKYLAFVDSDDFVEQDTYVQALRLAESDDLDMVLFNATYHFEGRQPDRPVYTDLAESSTVMTGADWLRERLKTGRFLHMVWMHLYRRDFIEANRFRFVPRLIHEDVIWSTQVLLAARRVRHDPTRAYHYRIPIRRFSPEEKATRIQTIIDSSIFNARTLADMTKKVVDPELRWLLQEQWVDGAFSVFHKADQLPRLDRALRLKSLRRKGFFRLLWENAIDIRQRRRIMKYYLRSFVA
jgi:glycosyltransferase involved in cell wall biosynthesis